MGLIKHPQVVSSRMSAHYPAHVSCKLHYILRDATCSLPSPLRDVSDDTTRNLCEKDPRATSALTDLATVTHSSHTLDLPPSAVFDTRISSEHFRNLNV